MTDKTVFEEWLDSPIVKRAVSKAGEGAEAVDVLEVLHELMLDVEDRSPGVPFRELWEGARCASVDNRAAFGDQEGSEHLGLGTLRARQAIGQTFLAQGAPTHEIDRTFGSRAAWGPGSNRGDFGSHPAIALLRSGMTRRQVAEQLGVTVGRIAQIHTKAIERGLL